MITSTTHRANYQTLSASLAYEASNLVRASVIIGCLTDAQSTNSSIGSIKLSPNAVKRYSTLGGFVSNTWRVISPSRSKSRRDWVNIRLDTSGIPRPSALNRFGPSCSKSSTKTVHFAEICDKTLRTGHLARSKPCAAYSIIFPWGRSRITVHFWLPMHKTLPPFQTQNKLLNETCLDFETL